ncbi:MAG: MBL fold metallo-hydrolase [Candidatus Thorarchaeota archaeon]|jgi:glyoxylase-like metal-dependent hydrolase (beta-lactamase superfamily II)
MSEYPAHIEIEPHVHLVRGKYEGRFPEANTLLIDDEILTLVDAGSNPEQVFSTLRDLGHQPEDLDRIVLTHYHADHKGYAAYLRRISDCEVICHPLARDAVESFQTMMKTIGIVSPETKEQWLNLLNSRLPHVQEDYIVDGTFRDDKPIDCGEVELVPIHSPGHTHDHTCFGINGHEKILLVDIDLTDFGPWYGNVVSDLEDFKRSIERIIDLQPKMGISSHLLDPVTDELAEQLSRYLAFFQQRDDEILHQIAEGVDTVKQLAQIPIIYPRIPYPVYLLFEEIMLDKHIEFLSKNDLVLLEDEQLQVLRT